MYDLIAIAVGQRGIAAAKNGRVGEQKQWSNLLFMYAVGVAGVVGMGNRMK